MPPAKPKRPPKTYGAHRERQQRRILDAARKLFDARGIDRVTMAELTSASGLQPSTLYQYFCNKDDIVWAIVSEVMEESAGRALQRIEAPPNAYARIAALLEFMADELSNHPANVRFMAQFDALYARDWPAERLLALESQIIPQGFKYYNKLIRDGIADGSLRSDLDPDLSMHAIVNAITGAQRRLASLGNKVELEYGQPIERLLGETIRVILLGLRAPESTAGQMLKPPKSVKATTPRRSS